MNIINLDKFKAIQKVLLDGKEWDIYGLTVDDYLHNTVLEDIEKATTDEARVTSTLDALEKFTNIPREVLVKQSFKVLTALILICQGIDPTKEKEEIAAEKSEKK